MIELNNETLAPHTSIAADGTVISSHSTLEAAIEAVLNAGGGRVETNQVLNVVVPADPDPEPEPEPEPVVLDAAATTSPSPSIEGQAVTLDGSDSTGNIVSYEWDDAAGERGQWPLGEGPVVTFIFNNEGEKLVRLTVTDDTGATDEVIVPHVVTAPVTVPDPEPEPEPEPEPDPDPVPPAGDIPTAANTGPRIDNLEVYNGRLVVRNDGEVVSGLHVKGYIDIKADNVTIEDCFVEYSGDAYAVRTYVGFKNTKVLHSKVTMAQSAKANGGVMGGANTVVRYCEISGHGDGIKAVPNGTYEYNWIHMSKPSSSDKHLDAIQGGHNNTMIRGNVLWVPYSDGGNAAYINTTFADVPPNNVVITDNWIAGGTFAVYVEKTKQHDCMTNIEVTNNRFAPTHRWGRIRDEGCPALIEGNTSWDDWDNYGDAEVWA